MIKCLQGPVPVALEGRMKRLQQPTRIFGNTPTSNAKENLKRSIKVDWFRRPPFNLRGGGGRVLGMDQNLFLTMIQQMYTFSQLLGHQIIHFTFSLEWTFLSEGNYLFQQLAATNYYHPFKVYYFIYYHFTILQFITLFITILPSSCLKLFISKKSLPLPLRLNGDPA